MRRVLRPAIVRAEEVSVIGVSAFTAWIPVFTSVSAERRCRGRDPADDVAQISERSKFLRVRNTKSADQAMVAKIAAVPVVWSWAFENRKWAASKKSQGKAAVSQGA